DFLGTRAEVRRNFLLQFLNRVGRRCDFNANLRRIHQWRLGAMQAIELGASPGGVCHEEPKGRGYGHLAKCLAAEDCEPLAEAPLDPSVVSAGRAHEHAAPEIELDLPWDICDARVLADIPVPHGQLIDRERGLDRL